jgi:hypothetical protein
LRQRFHDLPNRRQEPHVEHSVRFVEDEKFEARKIRGALSKAGQKRWKDRAESFSGSRFQRA